MTFHSNDLRSPVENVSVLLAEQRFLYLAGASHGERFQEYNLFGHPPLRHALRKKGQNVLRLQTVSVLAYHEQQRPLLPFGMLHADDGGGGHRRMSNGGIFQVDRTDPLAACLDQILDPVAYLQDTVRIDGCDIAGGKPTVPQRRVATLIVGADYPL